MDTECAGIGTDWRTQFSVATTVNFVFGQIETSYAMDDGGPKAILKKLRESPSIYLVESIDYLEDFDLLVEDTWAWIFKEQLNGWMRDPALWPDELTREMFHKWFDCELSTMIWDMLKARIKPAF